MKLIDAVVFGVVELIVDSFIVKWAWNILVAVGILHLPSLSFWYALALILLVRSLGRPNFDSARKNK